MLIPSSKAPKYKKLRTLKQVFDDYSYFYICPCCHRQTQEMPFLIPVLLNPSHFSWAESLRFHVSLFCSAALFKFGNILSLW